MKPSRSPHTTVPADETQDVASSDRWAIRWLFPALDGALTPLAPGGIRLGRDEGCDVELASRALAAWESTLGGIPDVAIARFESQRAKQRAPARLRYK